VSELPLGWIETEIGNLCELYNGRAFKKTEWTNHGIPIIRIQNLNNSSAMFNYYSGDVDPRNEVVPGNLLFAWSGTPGTSFGAHEWNGVRGALNQHIYKIDFDENKICKSFFRYAINQKLSELIENAQGAVGLRHVTKSTFTNTKIAFPPLNEQIRIANKLDSLLAKVDAAQARLEKIPALLKRFRQSVLAAATSGELTREWDKRGDEYYADIKHEIEITPRLARLEKLSDDEIELAQGFYGEVKWERWKLFSLEQLVDPERGIPYGIVQTGDAQEEGIPTVRCGDVLPLSVRIKSLKKVTPEIEQKYARTRLLGKEVLLAIRGTVGNAAVVTQNLADLNANISREVAMIPVREGISPDYIAVLLQSPGGFRCLAEKVRGVAQKGINLADVKRFVTPLPTLDEQLEIVRRVESLLTLADIVEKQHGEVAQRIDRLTQSLLSKAFRGELVPQDPSDEPASDLLNRIQSERVQGGPSTKNSKKSLKQIKAKISSGKSKMSKSRKDDDVWHKPYLANIIEKIGPSIGAQELYGKADLCVGEFYKQLAWEEKQNFIVAEGDMLRLIK
jgi:type I restriction enzyme S subunit